MSASAARRVTPRPGRVACGEDDTNAMRIPLRLIVLCLCALLPVAARAAIFVCRANDGSLLTTDHLSAECLSNGGREMNPDGSVRRVIPPGGRAAVAPPPAPATSASRQRQREDRALLIRYPDVASLDAAERADLQGPQALIDSANAQLADLRRKARALAQEQQFYQHHAEPADLRGRIETNRVLIQQQQSLIATQKAELDGIRARYAALRQRLAALWAHSAGN